MAPHERGALIERVAKALCRFRHTPRSIDESVAPGRELWMRYVPDAEVAIEAMNLPSPEDGGITQALVEMARVNAVAEYKAAQPEGDAIWNEALEAAMQECMRLEHKGKDDHRNSWMGNAVVAIEKLLRTTPQLMQEGDLNGHHR